MTTGRINQITIFKLSFSTASPEGTAERKAEQVFSFGKNCIIPLGNLRKLSSSVAWGFVLSWFATNWDITLKAQMGKPEWSLKASSLNAHLLPPGLRVQGRSRMCTRLTNIHYSHTIIQ